MWHEHVDWYGLGNENKKARAAHLRALFLLFSNFQKQLELYNKPYQTWVLVYEFDSGQDAVYVHTLNENDDNFPTKFEKAVVDEEPYELVRPFIDECEYGYGHLISDDGSPIYVIYSKHHGIPPIE